MEESNLRKIIREEISQLVLMNKEVLNVDEAAAYLNYTPDYVRKLVKRKEIRGSQPLGKVIFIHRNDLVDFALGRNRNIQEEATRLASSYVLKQSFKK